MFKRIPINKSLFNTAILIQQS